MVAVAVAHRIFADVPRLVLDRLYDRGAGRHVLLVQLIGVLGPEVMLVTSRR
jgi:hypothetical protein